MTENHDYNAPPRGTENWDRLLNENFSDLDVDVEIRDTEANRGNYDPKEGAKYVATDTGATYRGDGSSWNRLPVGSALGDDDEILFGANDDFALVYDSTADEFQVVDTVNGADVLTFDRNSTLYPGGPIDARGNGSQSVLYWDTDGWDTGDYAFLRPTGTGGPSSQAAKILFRDDSAGTFTAPIEFYGDGRVEMPNGALNVASAGDGVGVSNAENLSGKTGNFDGEIRMDDGTNTAARMTACVWDGTNAVWRPVNDPATGSFT